MKPQSYTYSHTENNKQRANKQKQTIGKFRMLGMEFSQGRTYYLSVQFQMVT